MEGGGSAFGVYNLGDSGGDGDILPGEANVLRCAACDAGGDIDAGFFSFEHYGDVRHDDACVLGMGGVFLGKGSGGGE